MEHGAGKKEKVKRKKEKEYRYRVYSIWKPLITGKVNYRVY